MLTGVSLAPFQVSRDGDARRAFDDPMLYIEDQPHRLADLRFGDQRVIINQSLAELESDGAFLEAARSAFRDRRLFRDFDDLARAQTFIERARILGPAADDAGVWADGFQISRYSGDQPAPSDCYEDRVDPVQLSRKFQSDCALAGDDLQVVIRRDENLARFPSGFARSVFRFEAIAGGRDGDSAEALDNRQFLFRDVARQIDRRRRPRVAGRVTDAHAVVARRGRDYASAQLPVVERENLVRRATEFERAGELQVFEFEVDSGVSQPAQMKRVIDRRLAREWADARFGFDYVLSGKH